MCGIIGAVAQSAAKSVLDGLEKLEYRGYDSSGISIITNNQIQTRKAQGKLYNLKRSLNELPLDGQWGVGHTRWATHGEANVKNAHPHQCGIVSVVHNGIIENYLSLKERLLSFGHQFHSATDSEVVPHLINHYLSLGMSCEEAINSAIADLEGSYALGILIGGEDNSLYAIKQNSPLVISEGNEGFYIASDVLALSHDAGKIYYPKNNELISLNTKEIRLHHNSKSKRICFVKNTDRNQLISKEGYSSFMEKEISEQVELFDQFSFDRNDVTFDKIDFKSLNKITIVACGTSYYAASVAKYWFEKYAKISVEIDVASEYRYRSPIINPNELSIFVSQSGETADTLAALEFANKKNTKTLGLVNVPTSTIARNVDYMFEIKAGPEIGVASTKAFTCQLALFYKMAIEAGIQRESMDESEFYKLKTNFLYLPQLIRSMINQADKIKALAKKLVTYPSIIFLGRGIMTPIAMEAALKLKEISYIHAEAYPAGELKHGPIALVDEKMPVVVIAPNDALTDKLISNIKEVQARNAPVFVIGDKSILKHIDLQKGGFFELPDIEESIQPIVSVIPLQYLALFCGQALNKNVDQPRNLAKSVTVE